MSDDETSDSVILPQRKTLGHLTPNWVGSEAVFFITICTQPRGKNQLCHSAVSAELFEAITHRQKTYTWHCRLCLLMPDHLHALISFPPSQSMKKVISNFKENTAKPTEIQWQREFFDHRIRNSDALQLKANYIRQNPVRAGLIQNAPDWPYILTPDS